MGTSGSAQGLSRSEGARRGGKETSVTSLEVTVKVKSYDCDLYEENTAARESTPAALTAAASVF